MRQTKTGILLANLGTPDAPTPEAVKRYLRQFLSDPRVVDTSPALWCAAAAWCDFAAASAACGKAVPVNLDGRRFPTDGLQQGATAGAGTTSA